MLDCSKESSMTLMMIVTWINNYLDLGVGVWIKSGKRNKRYNDSNLHQEQQYCKMEANGEDSDIDFDDEQEIIQEKPVIDDELQGAYNQRKLESITVKENKQLILYILFSTYRQEVDAIAAKYHCFIKISMSCYVISTDPENRDKLGECRMEISKFINQIHFSEKDNFSTQKDKCNNIHDQVKYSNSPYFEKLFTEESIMLTCFDQRIFPFSRILTEKQIDQKIAAITKNKLIFAIRFSSRKSKFSQVQIILKEARIYLQKMFEYNKEMLKDRGVHSEINKTNNFVYLIGQSQRNLMQAKAIIKNVLESMVCLIVESTSVDLKVLSKFLEKAANFPVHVANFNQKGFMVITKDNIIKQLALKSNKFFKYLGIQVYNLDGERLPTSPKVGIFVIKTLGFNSKMERIRNICKDKGYDLFMNCGIYYINQVFYSSEKQNDDVIRQLLGPIMVGLEESKKKYDVTKKLPDNHENKPLNQASENKLKYILKGGRKQEEVLSQKFRRDVLCEKVQMRKEFYIAYNCIQTKQKLQYWKLNESGQEGQQVGEEELKPGKYLRGLKRIGEDGTIGFIFEQIITII